MNIFSTSSDPLFLSLYSLSGELVKSLPANWLSAGVNAIPLDLNGLDNGLYIIRDTQGMVNQKLVIAR